MNYERPRRSPAEQAALDRADTRQFWRIAVIFTIAIAAMTGIYVVVADAVRPPSPETGATAQVDEPAIPLPDGGQEPTDPGDRGSSEQLLLMGGLFVVLAGGAAWVVHSSRRARRRLAAELTAEAATDGADGGDESTGHVTSPGAVSLSPGSPEPR
ncbi:MAG TPA: hypothetical protein VFN21_10460 [Acidimicrobiales bacterium]|nr:hypothetical protein [Acidimicrobiales bacterium]